MASAALFIEVGTLEAAASMWSTCLQPVCRPQVQLDTSLTKEKCNVILTIWLVNVGLWGFHKFTGNKVLHESRSQQPPEQSSGSSSHLDRIILTPLHTLLNFQKQMSRTQLFQWRRRHGHGHSKMHISCNIGIILLLCVRSLLMN